MKTQVINAVWIPEQQGKFSSTTLIRSKPRDLPRASAPARRLLTDTIRRNFAECVRRSSRILQARAYHLLNGVTGWIARGIGAPLVAVGRTEDPQFRQHYKLRRVRIGVLTLMAPNRS